MLTGGRPRRLDTAVTDAKRTASSPLAAASAPTTQALNAQALKPFALIIASGHLPVLMSGPLRFRLLQPLQGLRHALTRHGGRNPEGGPPQVRVRVRRRRPPGLRRRLLRWIARIERAWLQLLYAAGSRRAGPGRRRGQSRRPQRKRSS